MLELKSDSRHAKAVQQGIHERPGVVAWSRVNNYSSCLVEDDQMIILMDDLKRQVLRISFSCHNKIM